MVPLSLVPALALLFFYVSNFRSMCAVPNMAVFCGFLTSWFPGMLLTYYYYHHRHHHHHHHHHHHPRHSLHSSLTKRHNSTVSLTHQTLHIHRSAKNLLTIRHALSITALCIIIYRAGRRSGSFRLSCSLSVIIPSVDCTNGIIQDVFSRHFVVSPPFKSAHFCSFSVMAI